MVMQENQMGRFSVEVELANDADLVRAMDGHICMAQVRRAKVRGVVDSGATRVVIPESLANQLGLQVVGQTDVKYADGRVASRSIVDRLRFTYGGRQSVFNAIVEPDRESILIGAIVLEDLDFLIDCKLQKLVPRNPDHIISEVE
jgi:predicted aspartyl protease